MTDEREKLIYCVRQQLAVVRTHSEQYANNVSVKIAGADVKTLELILGDVIAYQLDYEHKIKNKPARRRGDYDYR
ncbi:hypothetical protein CHT76_08690 [Listeria monocytogenes]|nr:hypothetical protein [Listeria monocytogenes]EAG8712033.1 hypothetical protein [Listeria monocytogenes]EAG8730879.1 hypothetical protein [Listeria monocytogenes]